MRLFFFIYLLTLSSLHWKTSSDPLQIIGCFIRHFTTIFVINTQTSFHFQRHIFDLFFFGGHLGFLSELKYDKIRNAEYDLQFLFNIYRMKIIFQDCNICCRN